MLTTLLILAALADSPKADTAPACPSCATKAKTPATCPDACKCPFPGACGHPGCHCGFALGWVPPPKDEWRAFTANPAWEVFGHEWNGVFIYSNRRLRRDVPQVPASKATAKPPQGYICRCGTLCAAKRGGICETGCGCPIGH